MEPKVISTGLSRGCSMGGKLSQRWLSQLGCRLGSVPMEVSTWSILYTSDAVKILCRFDKADVDSPKLEGKSGFNLFGWLESKPCSPTAMAEL